MKNTAGGKPPAVVFACSMPKGTRLLLWVATTKMEQCQQPYRLPSLLHGLSHGLKIARQLSIFAPVCALVPPFRVHPSYKKFQRPIWVSGIFGTPKGTRLHFRQMRKLWFASVEPSAATVHRTVAFKSSSPLLLAKY